MKQPPEKTSVLKKDKELRLKSVVGKSTQVDWPDLSVEESNKVIELLRSFFGPHLKQLTAEARQKLEPDGEKSKSKSKKRVRINVKTIFPNLVFGINEVTKFMERNQTKVFIICKSDANPVSLVQHLAIMSFVKKIPMVSLNNSAVNFLGRFFSIPRLSVVGIKMVNDEDKLLQITEQLISVGKKYPVMIPWLDESNIHVLKPLVVNSVTSSKKQSAGSNKKQKQDNFTKKTKTEPQNNNNDTKQKKRKEQPLADQTQKKQKSEQ